MSMMSQNQMIEANMVASLFLPSLQMVCFSILAKEC